MTEIKRTPAIFAVLVLVSFLLALQPVVGMEEEFGPLGDLKPYVETYNQNVDEIPFIKTLIGDERINCEIYLYNGTVLIYGIETGKGAKVISFEVGEIADPTMKMSTSESTIRTIMNSEDPVSAFQVAFNSGAIKLEGVGLVNKIKVGAMGVAMKVYGFVQGLRE